MSARRTYRVWGLAAAAWCVAFGVLSLYWAAGGMLGVDQLAVSLQERADERETGFVAIVAATGIAKLGAAIVPLWLVFRPPSRTARKVLLFLCGAGGVLLSLYGLADVVAGSIRAARGTMENAIWYAALWGPIWLLGGVLFLMTAWTFDAEWRRRLRPDVQPAALLAGSGQEDEGMPMDDAVERQVRAYNTHDIDGFVACYAEAVVIEDAEGNVIMSGTEEMREKYGRRFAEFPNLQAEIVTRIRVGSYVVDEERITGWPGGDVHAVAIYRLDSRGSIDHVRLLH